MRHDDLFLESTLSEQPLTISQVTSLIRGDLERRFPDIVVEGEISNCKAAASGHLYFSLKDEGAVLQAVMFRRDFISLPFVPKDGMKVTARGGISVYPGRGQYQLIVRSMKKAGIGDILAMLEERKRQFAREGLFDAEKKRSIPRFPQRIAVVTSPAGAAVRDIIRVASRRNPGISILVLPALVQGEEAAASIATRIRQANIWKLADVLIVGRGGGSIEDLLPFSDERVVRAIAASEMPVISAVGHETDWALSDYAADLRAPTPSAAAELACGDRALIYREISHFSAIMAQSMNHTLTRERQHLASLSPRSMEDLLLRRHLELSQRFDATLDMLLTPMREALERSRTRLRIVEQSLVLSNPREIMKRGFSVVRARSSSTTEASLELGIIRSAEELCPGEGIRISFYRGEADATVERIVPSDSRSE